MYVCRITLRLAYLFIDYICGITLNWGNGCASEIMCSSDANAGISCAWISAERPEKKQLRR